MITPFASSALSALVATVKLWLLAPAVIVTVTVPSATKSLCGASATVTVTARSAAGAGLADSVKPAAVPSVTPEPPVMVISGRTTSSSASTICPLPLRVPLAPPSSPVAVSTGALPVVVDGIDTVTVRSSVSTSSSALRVTSTWLAPAPLVGPAKVTAALAPPRLAQLTPVGSGLGQARLKSVPTVPPAKPSGTPSDSPLTSPRGSASRMVAVSLLASSALASGVLKVTTVASSSVSVRVCTFAPPTL